MENENELFKVRIEKLSNLRNMGIEPYADRYERTHLSSEIVENFEELEEKTVSLAGRIMSKRDQGKVIFAHIQDMGGKIQLYIRKDAVGEEIFGVIKTYDIGDIVGIKGTVFRTKRGEISIKTYTVQMLSKSLRVLPEKFHGL
ncbi:MAG: OB-fold nucleic acid binding domain-containing protein, partial [Eubacteriales bacterium]